MFLYFIKKKDSIDNDEEKEYYKTDYGKKGSVQAVWNKANIVTGKNPNIWRKDCTGKLIRRNNYGSNLSSPYCWQIDHIIPKSKKGSNQLYNLQPLNCKDNRVFSNTRQKCSYPYCCIGWN